MLNWKHIFDEAPDRVLKAGAALFRREDPVRFMYIVRSGMIALERPIADGSTLILHQATHGMALAEASLFADIYHCDAVARELSVVAAIPRLTFFSALRKSPDVALSLIEAHSKEVQKQRARVEILRLRRVADRLDVWLDLYGKPAEGEWVNVAQEIGVSQPALYRELAKRRD